MQQDTASGPALPDWVAIAVALAALVVSGITLWIQLVDRRRADASIVETYFDGIRGAIVVKNSGSRSVYDVRVELQVSGDDAPLDTRRTFRIAPGGEALFRPAAPIAGADLMGPELLHVRAELSDWSGRRWRRTNRGELKRVRWNRLPANM